MDKNTEYFLPYAKFQELIEHLIAANYLCVGPQVRDGAIIYAPFTQISQLPWGIREEQSPGKYQLNKIAQQQAFAFANGPQAFKPFLFKPQETAWSVERDPAGKLIFKSEPAAEPAIAFIGARACDLAGLAIQDQVFLNTQHPNLRYQKRRENLFIIAVNCSYSAANCFCVSAGTGPQIKNNFDLGFTEIENGFMVEIGSQAGAKIIEPLNLEFIQAQQKEAAQQVVATAAAMQTKRIPHDNQASLRAVLFANLDHPRWDEVAERCLSCGNCTQVCPTCFCHTETSIASLDGSKSVQEQAWDSCFNAGHSYVAQKVLRDTTSKRYRQWLTHKVGSWFDQFDTSGCVGCGRCISWCPVGIDLTAELAAITQESNCR